MTASQEITNRVNEFVEKLQDRTNKEYATRYANLTPSLIVIAEGSKFYKIIKLDEGSRSVHCFISKENGDIYKAASWRIPAKHVRGNIFADDYGMSAVTIYGANYLK